MLLSKVSQTLRFSLIKSEKNFFSSINKCISTNENTSGSGNSFDKIFVHNSICQKFKPIFHSGLLNKQFYQFSKSKTYIDHYNSIQTEIKEKK